MQYNLDDHANGLINGATSTTLRGVRFIRKRLLVYGMALFLLTGLYVLVPGVVMGMDMNGTNGTHGEKLNALATKAMNPVAKMISVPFQNNFNFGVGPDDVTQYVLDIQPVVPFTLNEDWNLITRTIIPFISQPSAGPDQPSMTGLGDINPTLWLSPASSREMFWGVGAAFTLPTGTETQLTSGKWSLGPSAVLMWTPGKWMIGAVANEQWSVAGWSDEKVNTTFIQPMLVYHLSDGWYLASVPTMTANWEAELSKDRWTVPIGGGAGRVFKLGGQAMNLQLQAFHNVEKPTDGPDWQLRFQLQFLFPK